MGDKRVCKVKTYFFTPISVAPETPVHDALAMFKKERFSGIFRDAPPNVGRIANPTYAAPPDMLVYHGNSQ
jgi:hypothetical protein